jgi:farnesyl diphosphate synthase
MKVSRRKPGMPDFANWSRTRQAEIERQLAEVLPSASVAPQRLHDAMRYTVLGGGKRVRPLLAFAAGEVAGADSQRVCTAACAVELIHAYSLVHDDLPAMDDDDLRRGQPSCHREYDEATALLVGDALQSLAFEILSRPALLADPPRQLAMIHMLAVASGSRGMAGGQAFDLAAAGKSLSLPELEFMHIHKTGALIRASVQLGAACGDPLPDRETGRLEHYANCVGLAFQVMDDVLDAESDSVTLGKTAGKDAVGNKPTYVTALGLNEAREHATRLKKEALDATASLGEKARRLAELAEFIVARSF